MISKLVETKKKLVTGRVGVLFQCVLRVNVGRVGKGHVAFAAGEHLAADDRNLFGVERLPVIRRPVSAWRVQ